MSWQSKFSPAIDFTSGGGGSSNGGSSSGGGGGSTSRKPAAKPAEANKPKKADPARFQKHEEVTYYYKDGEPPAEAVIISVGVDDPDERDYQIQTNDGRIINSGENKLRFRGEGPPPFHRYSSNAVARRTTSLYSATALSDADKTILSESVARKAAIREKFAKRIHDAYDSIGEKNHTGRSQLHDGLVKNAEDAEKARFTVLKERKADLREVRDEALEDEKRVWDAIIS